MTWQLFDSTIIGNQSQVLLDDQFIGDTPGEDLPNLAWFGIWCQQDTEGHYWNPAETDKLDDIESDLLGLAAQFSNCWGVYVRRVVTSGKREYLLLRRRCGHAWGNAGIAEPVSRLPHRV